MKWIKENPGKTEADYKNMKMDKFKAKTAAMMKKKNSRIHRLNDRNRSWSFLKTLLCSASYLID